MSPETAPTASAEAPRINIQAYASFAGDVLGISRQSPEWSRIEGLMDPNSIVKLPEAVESALSQLRPEKADMLRRRFGLLTPGENGISYQELAPYVGSYAPNTVRLMVRKALGSLRTPERLEPLNRAIYPERYSE